MYLSLLLILLQPVPVIRLHLLVVEADERPIRTSPESNFLFFPRVVFLSSIPEILQVTLATVKRRIK